MARCEKSNAFLALIWRLTLPKGIQMAKISSWIGNIFHICKWKVFPISTFAIVDEIASVELREIQVAL